MQNAADTVRAQTEAIILQQLRKADSYGYEINKAVQQSSGGEIDLKEATLYTAFRRLEEAGLICSYWGDESGGARRRYYRITAAGMEASQTQIREWITAKSTLDTLFSSEVIQP